MLESCDNRAGGRDNGPTQRATVRCQPPSVKATALYLLNSWRRKSWGVSARWRQKKSRGRLLIACAVWALITWPGGGGWRRSAPPSL